MCVTEQINGWTSSDITYSLYSGTDIGRHAYAHVTVRCRKPIPYAQPNLLYGRRLAHSLVVCRSKSLTEEKIPILKSHGRCVHPSTPSMCVVSSCMSFSDARQPCVCCPVVPSAIIMHPSTPIDDSCHIWRNAGSFLFQWPADGARFGGCSGDDTFLTRCLDRRKS